MTGTQAVRRREAALTALVTTAVLVMVVVAVDAVRWHLPALLAGGHPPPDAHALALLVLLAVQVVVVWRAGRSLLRLRSAQRRLRRLPERGRRTVAGRPVTVVGGTEPRAYCAGLVRPRVCVSESALARLSPEELRAVVEHEAGHVRRHDPLRLAVAQVAADGFGLPRVTTRQAALADLAADAAAVSALGSPRALAAALVRLRDPTPERVDHLLGRPLPAPSRALSACAAGVLAALALLAGALLLLPSDPALPLLLLPAVAVPALLAFRASA